MEMLNVVNVVSCFLCVSDTMDIILWQRYCIRCYWDFSELTDFVWDILVSSYPGYYFSHFLDKRVHIREVQMF